MELHIDWSCCDTETKKNLTESVDELREEAKNKNVGEGVFISEDRELGIEVLENMADALKGDENAE